jgi:hypothetical protein
MSLMNAISEYLATATILPVPMSKVKAFEGKLKGLTKKAAKNGVDAIQVATIGDLDVRVSRPVVCWENGDRFLRNVQMWENCRAYSITGVFPRMKQQYDLVGVVEFDSGMIILREVPGRTIPIEYRTTTTHCDHCKTRRPRSQVVIVQDVTTGAFLQVGGNCAGEFLGRTLKSVLADFEVRTFIDATLAGGGGDEEYGGSGYLPALNTRLFLACVAQAVRIHGAYRSAKYEGISTASAALTTYDNQGHHDTVLPSDADYARAGEMIEAAKALLDKPMSDLSTYEWNMKMGIDAEFMNRKLANIVASLPAFLNRFNKVEPKAKAVSEHVGTEGARSTFTLTYIRSANWDSQFGTQYLHTFNDADGNVVIWKTGNALSVDYSTYANPGDTVVLKGTVKEHGEYKGTKQTSLARCSLQSISKPAQEVA